MGIRPPKYQKFPLFGKRVADTGRFPWPISKILKVFYTPNYATLVFQIWRDSLHRLRSYWWETAHRSIRPNFSVHPVGKTMRKLLEIGRGVRPCEATLYQKVEIFDIFWAAFLPPCGDWGEIFHSQADPRARRPRQVWRESVQQVAPAERKTWFLACE